MDDKTDNWKKYYQKALTRPHAMRTELAIQLNESGLNVAVDCGCGTGSDVEYLSKQDYKVFGFDVNQDSVTICRDRFGSLAQVNIEQASFETFNYPETGVIVANSSLFFADPLQFSKTWAKIESSIAIGGVFAGDFMGFKDSWAQGFRIPTTALTEQKVRDLFTNFEIVKFSERDELGKTTIGVEKHWHTYGVVAIKRT
ncbi:class I SAM-dependent methyltransferase [Grimontia sp. NTOU-MAR1]|uniref:class I SAM-dependent methyltransferase n=1 Tax=Grimontia sp. NTOU-MAR1 TaxID=3111011 RepID=UPI002DB93295|nr:methyltransferase domain-containing protein [Grimontia sp. NTOU-MAR1]WRV98534.1 methyltransferase domain-containing protein [Grimontia sp. NTOU-MAR1]